MAILANFRDQEPGSPSFTLQQIFRPVCRISVELLVVVEHGAEHAADTDWTSALCRPKTVSIAI